MTAVICFLLGVMVWLQVAWMRGQAFHNLLVARCDCALQAAGFTTKLECPKRLPDGRLDFIDIYATRSDFVVAVEVETSARYADTNAAKADALGLPLWIVVANRAVANAVERRLPLVTAPIRILLLPELIAGLTRAGDLIPPANGRTKTQKQNPGGRP